MEVSGEKSLSARNLFRARRGPAWPVNAPLIDERRIKQKAAEAEGNINDVYLFTGDWRRVERFIEKSVQGSSQTHFKSTRIHQGLHLRTSYSVVVAGCVLYEAECVRFQAH